LGFEIGRIETAAGTHRCLFCRAQIEGSKGVRVRENRWRRLALQYIRAPPGKLRRSCERAVAANDDSQFPEKIRHD
jgi:hypothetical protein